MREKQNDPLERRNSLFAVCDPIKSSFHSQLSRSAELGLPTLDPNRQMLLIFDGRGRNLPLTSLLLECHK